MLSIFAGINVAVGKIVNSKPGFLVFPGIRRTESSKPHIFWQPVLLVLSFLLRGGPCTATTIIAIRSPNYVVLGSDSRVSAMSENQDISGLGCKIQRSGGVFFGAAGLFAGRSFNAYELARTASFGGGDIATIANRFAQNAQAPFAAFVRSVKDINPTAFGRFCNNKDCLETAFVGIEDGIPKLSVRSFRVAVTKDGEIDVQRSDDRDCPGDCETGAMDASLGNHNNADALFKRTQRFWRVKGIIQGIDELIREEIRFSPTDDALPISVLVIDIRGPRWAPGYQGLCPDIH